jgi:hypothetical protein
MISYLKHSDIDKQKWDHCIRMSPNSLVYGCSWYLDMVSPYWEALVADDYEAIMPLTVKSKFGINYIFLPDYTQQLGIFSSKPIDGSQIEQFIRNIPSKYKLVEINFNSSNDISGISLDKKVRINYELDLNLPYKALYSFYSDSNKDSLKRAYKNDRLEIIQDIDLPKLIELVRISSPVRLKKESIKILTELHRKAVAENICKLYGLYDEEKKLIAASSFILFKNRLLFFTSVSSKEGKKKRAMFQMLDYIISKNAGSKMILDFEGSNIPGIARFFAGFGSQPVKYFNIKIERFPMLVKSTFSLYRILKSGRHK